MLIMTLLLSCAGCGVYYSESDYRKYVLDPEGYIDYHLGEDHPLADILAGPVGQTFFSFMRDLAIKTKERDERRKQEAALKDSATEGTESKPALLAYDTHGLENLFLDDDWDYLKEDNGFLDFTGNISHTIMNAKGKYKQAFRSYIIEFIVENEDRYEMSNISYKERETLLYDFLGALDEAIGEELENLDNVSSASENLLDIKASVVALRSYKDSGKTIDEVFELDFSMCMKDLRQFLDTNSYTEFNMKVEVPDTIGHFFGQVADAASFVSLAIDVADAVESVSDVLYIKEKVDLFFELQEIFAVIVQNASNDFMRDAAQEVWNEFSGGWIPDLADLTVREGVHAVIDISPVLSAVTSGIDLLLISFTPIKDLDAAYAADAVKHIKMASCALLSEYTYSTEGNVYYYEAQYETEVNVYLMHCLQTELVWTYTINNGKKDNAIVQEYFRLEGIKVPKAAEKYIIN